MSKAKIISMIWIDNSRIVAIFAVVFLHTAADVVNRSGFGSGYWWIGNIYDSFVRWCIPVFVMISGALLLDPNKKEDISTFYTKRISRILLPILFWSSFFLLWGMLKEIVKGDPPSLVRLFKRVTSGIPYYHLWFLYMIMTLYLFTPFFRKIVAYSTRGEIKILVIIAFLMAALNTIAARLFEGSSILFSNWFLSYIPFFFLGHLIRTDKRIYSKTLLCVSFFLSSCLTALGCYVMATNKGLSAGLYFYEYLSITVIPMSVSIIYLLKSLIIPIIGEKFIKSLSFLTFGVYLIHPIFLETIQYFGFGPRNFNPAVSIPVVAIIVLTFSFLTSWIIYQVPYLKRTI